MDTKFEIIFSLDAEQDIADIYQYISVCKSNKTAADRLMVKIDKGICYLEKSPYLYPMANIKDYRKCRVDNYIVFYRILEDKKIVRILRVYHGSQDYESHF